MKFGLPPEIAHFLSLRGLGQEDEETRCNLARLIPIDQILDKCSGQEIRALVTAADSLNFAHAVSNWARQQHRIELAQFADNYICERTHPMTTPSPVAPGIARLVGRWAQSHPELLVAEIHTLLRRKDCASIEILLEASHRSDLGLIAISQALEWGQRGLAEQLIPRVLVKAHANFAAELARRTDRDFARAILDWAERAERHDMVAAVLISTGHEALRPTPAKHFEALCTTLIRSYSRQEIKRCTQQACGLIESFGEDGLGRLAVWISRIAHQAQQENHISLSKAKLSAAVDLLIAKGPQTEPAFNHHVVLVSASCESLPALRALRQGGIDLDTRDVFGFTAMQRMCFFNRPASVLALVDAGADVNTPGLLGYTALHIAVAQGHLDLVRLLLSLGARPQAHTEGQAGALTPAMLAAALEKKELIPLLSQHSLVRLNPRQLDISSILRDVARAGASLPAV